MGYPAPLNESDLRLIHIFQSQPRAFFFVKLTIADLPSFKPARINEIHGGIGANALRWPLTQIYVQHVRWRKQTLWAILPHIRWTPVAPPLRSPNIRHFVRSRMG
jgi:hypothetical protein